MLLAVGLNRERVRRRREKKEISIDPLLPSALLSSPLISSHSRARSFLPFSDDDAQHIICSVSLPFFFSFGRVFFSMKRK